MRTSTVVDYFVISAMIIFIIYTSIGTSHNIVTIKKIAPKEMSKRNWEILQYNGWKRGSWSSHGGSVRYHVRNRDNHDIQYRVHVIYWGGELHYHYGQPEKLERVILAN